MNTEKILIAYFARKGKEETGRSVEIARKLGDILKAKGVDFNTFAITPTEMYPDNAAELEAITRSENEQHSRPELVGKYSGMRYVKDILLVAPNWWDNLPAGVLSWFDDYDFSDKKVVPVIASASSAEKVFEEIRNFLPHTWVTKGVEVSDKENDIESCLNEAILRLEETK